MKGPRGLSGGRRVGWALVLGVAVSVGVTVASRVGALAGWEARVVDAFQFLRGRAPTPGIVLVAIDEAAFRELGERQPLSRRYLADLGEFLLRGGARVVAFDVPLRTPTDPREDAALLAMLRRWEGADGGRVVFATVASVRRDRPGLEGYEAAPAFSPDIRGQAGFANAPVGEDGMIRRMVPVLPSVDGGYLPSFALATLAAYSRQTAEALLGGLKGAGDAVIRLPAADARGAIGKDEPIEVRALAARPWRIDFAGPPGTLATFPSGPLVRLARAGVRPEADNPFRGKIVLVGGTFEESRDFYPTPVGRMAGVEIQAHMIHTLLSRRAFLPPPWLWNLSLLLVACGAVAVLSLWLRPAWLALSALALVGALVAVSYEAYSRGGYWLDLAAPLAGMLAYLQGSRLLGRRRLRSAFGQFVSPEVVDRIAREGAELGGGLRTVSVLMSDLRGFTTLSEKLPPDRISAMMNEYFTAMVDVIMARRGMINDFIGDGILAVYGAPADDPDHAWHAVATALEMQAALRQLNERWQAGGRGTLAMGVAVHTGEVFAGNLGSPRRKKYTVLGDTVNTVARIEGLNRDLGTAILISGATLAAVRGRVEVRDRGAVHVKGRAQPVELYELLGPNRGEDRPPR